jgi:hypothetical protein
MRSWIGSVLQICTVHPSHPLNYGGTGHSAKHMVNMLEIETFDSEHGLKKLELRPENVALVFTIV